MTDLPVGISQTVFIEHIFTDDEFNCRGKLAPIDVDDLVENIRSNGLIQGVLVSELTLDSPLRLKGFKYRLIAGFRRTYAHTLLQRKIIKAEVIPPIPDKQARILNLSENLSRKMLDPLQEARAIKQLIDTGMTTKQIATALGCGNATVAKRLKILTLPAPIQEEIGKKLIPVNAIEQLVSLKSEDKQFALAKKMKEHIEKGERIGNVMSLRPKPKPYEKKLRNKKEIEDAIVMFLDAPGIGATLLTRALAWCAGNISDTEFTAHVKTEYPDFAGFSYTTTSEELEADLMKASKTAEERQGDTSGTEN